MKKYKTIGVLGGMGPEATAELYLRIIRIFQKQYGAKYDYDFPEIIILNLPIPDVVENSKPQEKVKSMLVEGIKKLEVAGANFIAIPCNTVTFYIEEMLDSISIPIINILEETAKEVIKKEQGQIGLIGTETTINTKIYEQVLKKFQILTLDKLQQVETTKIILNISSGEKNLKDKNKLREFIQVLKDKGVKKVILGCTELPLLVKENSDLIDTLDVLARAVVKKSVGD